MIHNSFASNAMQCEVFRTAYSHYLSSLSLFHFSTHVASLYSQSKTTNLKVRRALRSSKVCRARSQRKHLYSGYFSKCEQ